MLHDMFMVILNQWDSKNMNIPISIRIDENDNK